MKTCALHPCGLKQKLAAVVTASALAFTCALWPHASNGGTLWWDGSSGNSWNTVANWSTDIAGGADPAAVPGASDDVVFNANGTITTQIGTLGTNQAANSLTFRNNRTAAITLASSNLTLGAGGMAINESPAVNVTISAGVTLGAAQTWANNGGGTLTVSGTINNGGHLLTIANEPITLSGTVAGTGGLTKTGMGTLTVSPGWGSYSGTVTLSGGTLATDLIANGGSTSGLGSSGNSAANLTLDGGTLQFTSTLAQNTDRLFTLTANGGKLNASGNQAKTFTATGSVVVSGIGNRTLVLSGPAGFELTLTPIIPDPSSGKTAVSVTGGRVTLRGHSTYTGDTAVSGGGRLTLDFANASGAANIAGSGSSTLAMNGGTLALLGKNSTVNSQTFAGVSLSGGNSIVLTSGTSGSMSATLGTLTRGAGASVDFTLPASGSVAVGNANDSTGILGAWATVVGADYATVSGGNIAALAAAANNVETTWGTDGTQNLTASAGNTLTAHRSVHTFRYTGAAGALALGAYDLTTHGLLNGGSGLLTVSGTGALRFGANGNLFIGGAQNITLAAPLAGEGNLVKTGPGILTLSANNATFRGGVFVTGGTLANSAANPFGNVPIAILPGATLSVGTGNTYVRELTGDGAVSVGNNVLYVCALQDSLYSGVFSAGSAALSGLYGPGRMTATGANTGASWFRGTVIVNSGEFVYSGQAKQVFNDTYNGNIHNGGTVTLDNSTVNQLDRYATSSGTLTLNGGTFRFLGHATSPSSEAMSALTWGGTAASTVQIEAGSGTTAAVTFASFSRSAGGAGNFVMNSGASVLFTTAPGTVNGIVNGSFVNGTNFAAHSGVASTAVSALSSYTALGASGTDSNNSILDSNVTLTGARTTGSLKIDASSGAVTLANGGNNLVLGTATTLAAQILKVGANDAVISGSGALTHSTATAGDFIVRVHAGALTISAPVNMVGTAAFVKSGPGLLALAPSANWVSPNSADAIVAAEGSIRLDTAAAAFGGASCPQFRLSGGVFELTNGSSWLPTIGTGAGNLNWLSTGDGGFAAYGGTRTFGSAVTWDTANHPRNGHAILLNSASANAKIVLSNTINLNTASGTFFFREFRVADNPAETADKAEISGQIVNTGTDGTQGHLLKTGAGTLILSHANNTYNGETIVQNGTLEIASGGKLSAVTAGHGTVSVGQYVVRGVTLAGTLGGFGEIARPVEVLSGGTLNPADASACGTLTVSSTLKVDGIAKFDIRQDGSCDKVAGLTAPPVFGAGAVVRVNFVDASSYRAGTPDLITWTGNALATLPTLETVGLPVGHTATLSSTAGKLTLTVSNQGGTVFLFR